MLVDVFKCHEVGDHPTLVSRSMKLSFEEERKSVWELQAQSPVKWISLLGMQPILTDTFSLYRLVDMKGRAGAVWTEPMPKQHWHCSEHLSRGCLGMTYFLYVLGICFWYAAASLRRLGGLRLRVESSIGGRGEKGYTCEMLGML